MKTLFLLRSDTVLTEMSNFQETFGVSAHIFLALKERKWTTAIVNIQVC